MYKSKRFIHSIEKNYIFLCLPRKYQYFNFQQQRITTAFVSATGNCVWINSQRMCLCLYMVGSVMRIWTCMYVGGGVRDFLVLVSLNMNKRFEFAYDRTATLPSENTTTTERCDAHSSHNTANPQRNTTNQLIQVSYSEFKTIYIYSRLVFFVYKYCYQKFIIYLYKLCSDMNLLLSCFLHCTLIYMFARYLLNK